MGVQGRPTIVTDYLAYSRLRGLRETTLNLYRWRLSALADWLWRHHSTLIEDATSEQITAWRSQLAVQPQSITTYMVAIRAFYSWLLRMRYIDADPTWGVPIPRRRSGQPRPAPEEVVWHAIDHAPHRIRPWLVLAAGQGTRACEIAALERPDVMETARPRPQIRLVGKGGKVRTIPMSAWVWQELQAYGMPKRGYVFRRYDGRPGPNTAATISHLSNEYLEGIGAGVTLHQMRHRFATVALAGSRNNLRTTQDLLGHADPATTARYTAYHDQDAVDGVDAAQPPAVRPVRAVGDAELDAEPEE